MADPSPAPPQSPPNAPVFVRELDVLIRARYPLIWLVTFEEQRLDAVLRDLAAAHGKSLFTWSVTRGLRKEGGGRAAAPLEGTREPPEALGAIEKIAEPALVVLKGDLGADAHLGADRRPDDAGGLDEGGDVPADGGREIRPANSARAAGADPPFGPEGRATPRRPPR